MIFFPKIVIGDGERGLLYRDRRLRGVLVPGVHRYFDPFRRIEVEVYSVNARRYTGPDAGTLLASLGGEAYRHFLVADIGEAEVGLLSRDGRLEEVLPPGSRQLYWLGDAGLQVHTLPLERVPRVPPAIRLRLRQLGLLPRVAVTLDVPSGWAGLVTIDGQLGPVLASGSHAFWNFQSTILAETVDLRVQSLEVDRQALLTLDKVSIHMDLTASLRVHDPVKARQIAQVDVFVRHLLQHALRSIAASRSLDELIQDRSALDEQIQARLCPAVHRFGIEILGISVRNILLPDPLAENLNRQAEADNLPAGQPAPSPTETDALQAMLGIAQMIGSSTRPLSPLPAARPPHSMAGPD